MNDPNVNGRFVGVVVRRAQLDRHGAYRQLRHASWPLWTLFLLAFLCSGALTRDMNTNSALNRRLTDGGEQFERLCADVAIMLGAYQQFDARIFALLVEQLKEVRFPITDVD